MYKVRRTFREWTVAIWQIQTNSVWWHDKTMTGRKYESALTLPGVGDGDGVRVEVVLPFEEELMPRDDRWGVIDELPLVELFGDVVLDMVRNTEEAVADFLEINIFIYNYYFVVIITFLLSLNKAKQHCGLSSINPRHHLIILSRRNNTLVITVNGLRKFLFFFISLDTSNLCQLVFLTFIHKLQTQIDISLLSLFPTALYDRWNLRIYFQSLYALYLHNKRSNHFNICTFCYLLCFSDKIK